MKWMYLSYLISNELWKYNRITHNFHYRSADMSLNLPEREQSNVSVRKAWISFGTLPSKKRNLMAVRVSILLKSRPSLRCFQDCFLPRGAKDLSPPPLCIVVAVYVMMMCAMWTLRAYWSEEGHSLGLVRVGEWLRIHNM